jgi:hypothetical protein
MYHQLCEFWCWFFFNDSWILYQKDYKEEIMSKNLHQGSTAEKFTTNSSALRAFNPQQNSPSSKLTLTRAARILISSTQH